MITIIHGEDITKSRKYFIDERKKYPDAMAVSGITITLTEIVQIFEGNELFASEKHVFIEDFLSKRKKSKEAEQINKVIQQNQTQASVYFWESKDISPATLKQWKNGLIKQFKLPQTIFTLLDAIKPNNGKMLINLFHQTIQDEDSLFIFSMLIRQFRLLLAMTDIKATIQIEEVKRMSPWQKNKLQKQAAVFSIDQLKESYTRLYWIESGIKTGTLNISVEQAIDFFLIEL